MKYSFIVLICIYIILPSVTLSAQEKIISTVVSSSGGAGTVGTLKIEWTLGEMSVSGRLSGSGTDNYIIGFHQPWSSIVSCRTTDSLRLVKIHNATGGTNWTKKWNLSQPMTTWHGVQLSSSGCVAVLDMDGDNTTGDIENKISASPGNNLRGVIPWTDLDSLESLQILILRGNTGLIGTLPSRMGNLTQLKIMSLSHTSVSGTVPVEIGNLDSLIYLEIDHTNISGPLPSTVGSLASVEYLEFDNNPGLAGTALPNSFSGVPRLVGLYADSSGLTGSIPTTLTTAASLLIVDLFNNSLSGTIPAFSQPLLALRLENNRLENSNVQSRTGWGSQPWQGLQVQNNRLTFEDILPNIDVFRSFPASRYAPQDSFYRDTTIRVTAGQNLTIDLGIDRNVSTNVYNWRKVNGTALTINGNNSRTFSNIQSSDAGDYYVEVTNPGAPNLTLRSRRIKIEINCGTVTAAISGNRTFCSGDNVTLTASGGITYRWSNNTTQAAISIRSGGTYTVTVSDAGGCSNTAALTVTSAMRPELIPVSDITVCNGQMTPQILHTSNIPEARANGTNDTPSIGLAAIGTNSTGIAPFIAVNTGTVPVIATVTATPFLITAGLTCSGKTDTFTITVYPTPRPTIGGTTRFCAGSSTELTVSGGGTYRWNTNATTQTLSVNIPGPYTVTATNAAGCTGTATTSVIQNPTPSPAISGTPSFCEGANTILTASGGATYRWNNNSTNATLSVNMAGTYTVTATNAAGCTGTATTIIIQNPIPSPSISGSTSFCPGRSTTLTATGTGTYSWSNGVTTAALTVNTPGTYTVTLTAAGCSGTASVVVTQSNTLSPVISGTAAFCAGSSTTLTASGGGTYQWSNGTAMAATNINTAGIYTVVVTDASGCSGTATVIVTQSSAPTLTISGTPSFCEGANTILTASGGATYRWNNNSTNVTLSVNMAGTYTVIATNAAGCTGTATTIVIQNPKPSPAISGTTSFCEGANTVLTASGGATYRWNNNSTNATLSVNMAGIYAVTATNAAGCTGTATTIVIQNPIPSPAISGTTSFCEGANTILTASGGATYRWNNNSTNAALTVNMAGTYTVTATNAAGCTGTATTIVIQNPIPSPSISGSTSFCPGRSTTLTATGTGTYSWSNGVTTAALIVNTPGTYTVTLTAAGCSGTASVVVTQSNTLSPVISGTTAFCAGRSTTLTASGGGTYQWSNGTAMAATNINTAGTYTVVVTDASGCSGTATVVVTQSSAPTPAISGTTSFCKGGSATLTASGGNTYRWNNGITTANLTIRTAGTYTVVATNIAGCSATTTAIVTENARPSAALNAADSLTCTRGQVALSVRNPAAGQTYQWTTTGGNIVSGANTATVQVDRGGFYRVVVQTTGTTCADTATVTVPQRGLAISGIVADTKAPRCFTDNRGEIAVRSVGKGTAPYTYALGTGSFQSNTVFSGLKPGTFVLRVRGSDGCIAQQNVVLTGPDSIAVRIDTPEPMLEGSTFNLNIRVSGAQGLLQYNWNGPAMSCKNCAAPDVRPTSNTVYTVTVSDANGCTGTGAVTVTVKTTKPPDIITPNGDGRNDEFIIPDLEENPNKYPNNDIVIFNRWSQVVYKARPYQNEWRGTNQNGQDLPEGTYYYVLTLRDGIKNVIEGSVLIVR
jgi:gliding motility-associated-like protein